jgi:hypothetical protein
MENGYRARTATGSKTKVQSTNNAEMAYGRCSLPKYSMLGA